jgi:hypothetical protein
MGIHVEEVEETKRVRKERMQCDKCKTLCKDTPSANGWVVMAKLELKPAVGGFVAMSGADPFAQLHLCPACWPLFEAFVNDTNIVRAVPAEVAAELSGLRAAKEELALLKEQLTLTLDGLGMSAIRVQEGGGPENLGASIAVTLGAMLKKKAGVA